MRSRLVSIIGLILFSAAAVFWADGYTYMTNARAAGETVRLSDYAGSIANRLTGRPDAATLRHARRAEVQRAAEEAATAAALRGQETMHLKKVTESPEFVSREDSATRAPVRGFLDARDAEATGGAMHGGGAGQGGSIRFVAARK